MTELSSGGTLTKVRQTFGPFAGHGVVASTRTAIRNVDHLLSRRQGVRIFSDNEACILRFAPARSPCGFRLSDGVVIRSGDPIIDVHCWNERVPPMPKGGADLAWAQQVAGRLRQSLRLMAGAIAVTPGMQEARACRARVSFVGRGCSNASVSRIIDRMGFEDVDEGAMSLMARVHDLLGNVLIGALVWTHNPEAMRRDKLIREHRPVWSSRERLLSLHGPKGGAEPRP